MRRQVNNIVSVLWSAIRLSVRKVFNYKGLEFHLIERISPNVVLEVERGGSLKLGKKVRIHSGGKIKVRQGGHCEIGDNTRINYGCMFFCHEKIQIGSGVEFGPNVLVYDHDHDFRTKGGIKANKFKVAPVIIGDNVWIGAGTVILRGTSIGDNCVIGAGSVLKGSYPSDSVVIQQREITITEIGAKNKI